jgi:hypothetical protein
LQQWLQQKTKNTQEQSKFIYKVKKLCFLDIRVPRVGDLVWPRAGVAQWRLYCGAVVGGPFTDKVHHQRAYVGWGLQPGAALVSNVGNPLVDGRGGRRASYNDNPWVRHAHGRKA